MLQVFLFVFSHLAWFRDHINLGVYLFYLIRLCLSHQITNQYGDYQMYVINISKTYGRDNCNLAHYFRIETDALSIGYTYHGSNLKDLVEEMKVNYPEPQYKVTVSKVSTTKEEIEL